MVYFHTLIRYFFSLFLQEIWLPGGYKDLEKLLQIINPSTAQYFLLADIKFLMCNTFISRKTEFNDEQSMYIKMLRNVLVS